MTTIKVNKKREQWLMVALFASLVITLAFASIPRSHGQECISIVAENDKNYGSVELQLSNAEGCVAIYALYLQIEKSGSINEITLTPSGWTYGKIEDMAAFWLTETDPIRADSKVFGVELEGAKQYTLRWMAINGTWSPIAQGTLSIV